jgi:enoyl-CoA hydratase/carnithine racemase
MMEHVGTSQVGACLEIVFNRPDRKNALNNAMYETLANALNTADADPATRCILISAAPGAFCAGNDIKEFISAPPLTEDAPVFRMLRALTGNRKVLVAAVNGMAIGIGVTMLLHCDFVLAARDATFQLPFINLGIVPEAASSLLLPRLVGHQRAMELLVLGEQISAEQAWSYGMINRVVEPGALLSEARGLIGKILSKPPGALQQIKRLVTSRTTSVDDRMREENAALAAQITSPEGQEAIAALIEKRSPNFKLS